ncbi:MAG: HAD family hydrolase [Muribaculaceae bacterium]|nr:HAD family hydrolase [Muribaculaceae bacterium]
MDKDITYHGDVVVFDLDDTLIRERDYCREGFRRIERILTGGLVPEEGISVKFKGISVKFKGIADELEARLENREAYFDYLESRLAENGMADEMPMLVESYRNNAEAEIKLLPAMKVLLEELSKRGVVMGIVTDGRSGTQRQKIRSAGIDRYIEPQNILISEETGKDKTRPDNFRHFVTRYPEARCFYYIGDNEMKDFGIPNLMGWETYKVEWHSDNVHEEIENSDKMMQARGKIVNPEEFAEQIGAKGKGVI